MPLLTCHMHSWSQIKSGLENFKNKNKFHHSRNQKCKFN